MTVELVVLGLVLLLVLAWVLHEGIPGFGKLANQWEAPVLGY